MAIHAVVGNEERTSLSDLPFVAFEGIGELGETAAERKPGLDIVGVLDERRGLLLLTPNDLGLARLGRVARSGA
jgi:hypothetical protein